MRALAAAKVGVEPKEIEGFAYASADYIAEEWPRWDGDPMPIKHRIGKSQCNHALNFPRKITVLTHRLKHLGKKPVANEPAPTTYVGAKVDRTELEGGETKPRKPTEVKSKSDVWVSVVGARSTG